MKIKCIVMDDEPYALKQMAEYVRKTPFLDLAGECKSAAEAMLLVSDPTIMLLFADISMPGMSGMELTNILPDRVGVVFTTAHAEYAVDSYKVNAIDYLLKPISYEDFLRAAAKAHQEIINNLKLHESENREMKYLFVKSENKTVKINLDDIGYIESLNEYVRFHMGPKETVISLMSMKTLEEMLPEKKFMRVHRSYIVNLDKITTFERGRILFYDRIRIPVGDQYRDAFKSYLNSTSQ